MRLGGVGLDCDDPARLSEFWASMLKGEIVFANEDLAVVRLGDLLLNAYRVDDYRSPTWPEDLVPKQAHLDIAVGDLGAASERALDLGATRAQWQPDPSSYLVFLDPAGHPFCLTSQIPD
jgi:hypothetical protein